MMKGTFSLNAAVGVFMLAGILCLAYVSVHLGKIEMMGPNGYELNAVFSDAGGLRVGATVVIAGVEVGKVERIRLEDYDAHIQLRISGNLKLPEDTIASIKTRGLIGEQFIQLSPGGSDEDIPHNGRIRQTQPAMDLEELISKYAFGKI